MTIFNLREFTNLKHHINQQHSQVRSFLWNIAVYQTPIYRIFLPLFIVRPLKAQCCSLRSTSAVTVATAAISRQILSGTSQTFTKRSAEHDPDHLMVQIDFKIDQHIFSVPNSLPYLRKEVQRPETTHQARSWRAQGEHQAIIFLCHFNFLL